MENNIEQKIVAYECNILKNAFFHKETFLFLRDKVPSGLFQNNIRDVLWKTYVFIHDNDEDITRSTIEDVFINSNNQSHIQKIWDIFETSYPDEEQWKYQYKYLWEIYAKTNILRVIEEIKKKLANESVKSIIAWATDELVKYDSQDLTGFQMKLALTQTMNEIIDRKEGKINPYIKTGNPKFDDLIKMDFNEIILFAAAKKIGKTKMTLHLLMEILEIDPSIAVKIYSFELSEKELMYEFASRETELKSSQIQSKGYTLSENDIERIKSVMNKIETFDIDISTKPVSIDTLAVDFAKFCRERKDKRCILVIDNIGLLKETRGSQTEIDDHIAKTIVEIKDRTKALIIPIHHMTKEMEKEDRLRDAYRPRLEHLKGSTRIQDYANKVVLFHRPGHYDDLVKREEAKGTIQLNNGKFNRGEVIRKLFIAEVALNRNGEKGVIRFLHKLQFCQFKEWK